MSCPSWAVYFGGYSFFEPCQIIRQKAASIQKVVHFKRGCFHLFLAGIQVLYKTAIILSGLKDLFVKMLTILLI